MKTLYFECGMGAAGDMLTAALLEIVPDKDKCVRELNAIGIPGVMFEAVPAVKCGITGTHVSRLRGFIRRNISTSQYAEFLRKRSIRRQH